MSLVLFVLTATFHGFLHGIAVGALKDIKELVVIMIIVILFKIPISLSIGVAFMDTGRKCCDPIIIPFAFLFMLSTPAGILLMMLLPEDQTFFRKS
jgi:hypothetical protein